MLNWISKFYSIWSSIEEKKLDLECSINDEKGNPSFVKTALRTWLPKYNAEQIFLPEWCKNCLKTVQQNCAEILFNKIDK